MSATINWTIDWMSASTQTINGHSEVVLTAGWRCTGTETANNKTYTNSVYGTCSFPEPSEGGAFTPYNQLTQSQVVGWCWANGVNQTDIETSINNNINLQINPLVVQPPLPWSTQ
jgi:hypothetical protein